MAPEQHHGAINIDTAGMSTVLLPQVATVFENQNLLLLILLNTSIRTACSASASCCAMRAAVAAAALWTTVSADLIREATVAAATTVTKAPPFSSSTSAAVAGTLASLGHAATTTTSLPDLSLEAPNHHTNAFAAATNTSMAAAYMGQSEAAAHLDADGSCLGAPEAAAHMRISKFIQALGGVLRQHGRHVQRLHLGGCSAKELPEALLCDLLSRWVLLLTRQGGCGCEAVTLWLSHAG